MEEDIAELEIIIKTMKDVLHEEIKDTTEDVYTIDGRQFRALENLLTSYKQLEEDNKKLQRTKEISIERISKIIEGIKNDFPITLGKQQPLWQENTTKYIPKSKVKGIIERLDERIKNPERTSYWASYTISECIGIRRILQDILGEE